MTAATLVPLTVTWLNHHRAAVDLPDGTDCQLFFDARRDGWTTDLPGWCFKPVSPTYTDVLRRIQEDLS